MGDRSSCAIRELEMNGGKIKNGAWSKDVLPLVVAADAVTESGVRRRRIVDSGGVRTENVWVKEDSSMTSG